MSTRRRRAPAWARGAVPVERLVSTVSVLSLFLGC